MFFTASGLARKYHGLVFIQVRIQIRSNVISNMFCYCFYVSIRNSIGNVILFLGMRSMPPKLCTSKDTSSGQVLNLSFLILLMFKLKGYSDDSGVNSN